jgi:small conductance mechanosensitive channel
LEQYLSADTVALLQELLTIYGLKVIAALAVFVIGKWGANLVRRIIERGMTRGRVDATLVQFAGNVTYIALLAFAVVAAMGQLGIQTTSFIAILGAAGLAIGLALQGSLSNFAAGFLMILFRPFKAGDWIEAAGVTGKVSKIEIFTTTLLTGDNKTIIVPNSSVTGGNIINYSAESTRRVDMTIRVSYDDDLKKVRDTINRILDADNRVLKDPEPLVVVSELADSSVNFTVRVWVDAADYSGVLFDTTEAVKLRFDAEGISFPYPQQDVHIRKGSAQSLGS